MNVIDPGGCSVVSHVVASSKAEGRLWSHAARSLIPAVQSLMERTMSIPMESSIFVTSPRELVPFRDV